MENLGVGFFFLFLLNFGISWLNAWGCGRSWLEAKAAGGFTYFVTWCAAIMSACGFTWCYLFVLAFVAGTVHYHGHPLLATQYVQGMLELGYVIIIFPILGAGLGITISSWKDFSRRRSFATGGIATYNTFAQIYNTVEVIRFLPSILKDLEKVFDTKDKNSKLLMVLLVLIALLAGVLTTFGIIKHTARVHAYQVQAEINASAVSYAGHTTRH